MGFQNSLPRLISVLTTASTMLFLARASFAFCNPQSGQSTTCVQDIELNPKRLTAVEISTQSVTHIENRLVQDGLFKIPDVRIAIDRIKDRLVSSSSIGYFYDVAIGSPGKNTDCQIYEFSHLPPNPLGMSLLPRVDCTLAAEIILQYTSIVVDIQEEARGRGLDIGNLTEEQLLELYSSTRYFNTAILYAFHKLKGPAVAHDFGAAEEMWARKAWPSGVTEAGAELPAGGVVEYTVQPGDTWESISSAFIGDVGQSDDIAHINQKYFSNEALVSGEKIYVPLEVERWVEVEMNEQSPEAVAQEVYGDKAFSQLVTRRCRLRTAVKVPQCVLPVFHDVKAVYDAFFTE